jgi:hypothetical protein
VLLDWAEGKIAAIRDFRHASYAMDSLDVSPLWVTTALVPDMFP